MGGLAQHPQLTKAREQALWALASASNAGERSPLRRPWAVFGSVCVVVFMGSLLLGEQAP